VTKVVGFEAYETIMISLINVARCEPCQRLINFLGIPPTVCPACGKEMKMGQTTNPNPGGFDLHTEVPLSKVDLTPEQKAEYQKHWLEGSVQTLTETTTAKILDQANMTLVEAGPNPVGRTPEQQAEYEKFMADAGVKTDALGVPYIPVPLQISKIDLNELPKKDAITFEDFQKVELRAGTVVSAERVPKKDKLLKLMVNFGEAAPRQIIAGIGKTFEPALIVGHQYLFVTNLAPRDVLKGLTSHGMILATGPDAEHLTLVRPSSNVDIPDGSQFR